MNRISRYLGAILPARDTGFVPQVKRSCLSPLQLHVYAECMHLYNIITTKPNNYRLYILHFHSLQIHIFDTHLKTLRRSMTSKRNYYVHIDLGKQYSYISGPKEIIFHNSVNYILHHISGSSLW